MISSDWSPGAKPLKLTVDGETVSESAVSVTLTDDMNGTEDPKLGSTCAAMLTLVIQKPAVQYAGKSITAAVAGVPLGAFTVTSVAAKDERAEIVAIDAMGTAFEGAYTPAVESSTALTVVKDICAACGVPVGDVSDVADVPVSGLAAGQTCREMLGLMAALLGRNAHIDREGKLALRWYADSGVTVTADDYYPGELTKQDADYSIDRIECTVTKTTREEMEGGGTAETTETVVYAVGEGTTGISVTDEYMTQEILDGIYDRVGGLTYRPMTITFYGDARIETGDLIHVTDVAGTVYAVPVMKVVHVWDGGVKTTATAFGNPAEGLSRSSGGYLSRSVSNLMAEFARFKILQADNFRAVDAKIENIDIDTAQIEAAVVNELAARGVKANKITVTDEDGNIIFQADADAGAVRVAGFLADSESLYSEKVRVGQDAVTVYGDGNADTYGQRAELTNASMQWYGKTFGVLGYIGVTSVFGGTDIDGKLHINSVYKGEGVAIGRSGEDPVLVIDQYARIYPGLCMYQPIWMYNPNDPAYYSTITYQKVKDWDAARGAITNITRNGTTFTATKADGTTFTFTQQDNNTTYGLASTSANGLLRQLNGSTTQYMRGDGTWQTPPNTNTWRGIQNNLTSTSTTDSLSAYQGKVLNDKFASYLPLSGGTITGTTTFLGNASGTSNVYFQVQNANNNVCLATNKNAGVYSNKFAKWLISISTSGTVTANTSDRRYKEDRGLTPEAEALAILRGVDINNFVYKDDENEIVQNGVYAQQLRDVLRDEGIGYRPYLVLESPDPENNDYYYDLDTPEDLVRYGVDYARLVPVLWKGWQVHEDRIARLEREIAALREMLEGEE